MKKAEYYLVVWNYTWKHQQKIISHDFRQIEPKKCSNNTLFLCNSYYTGIITQTH